MIIVVWMRVYFTMCIRVWVVPTCTHTRLPNPTGRGYYSLTYPVGIPVYISGKTCRVFRFQVPIAISNAVTMKYMGMFDSTFF
jgi:hypothetical protein